MMEVNIMRKLGILGVSLILLFVLFVSPAYAGVDDPDGGITFGPYVLASGESASGNLTVFGPATLEEDAYFDGDLTVFGDASVAEGATVDGNFVVMGKVQIAGTVDGDLLSAGKITLSESAYVSGDVSAVEEIQTADGAVVDGEIAQINKDEMHWDFPGGIEFPDPIEIAPVEIERTPFWLRGLNMILEAVVTGGVMGLLAFVIVSIWPQQVGRVGQVFEDAPLTSYGMGFLGMLAILIGFLISVVTCILFPIGGVGMIAVGIGVLLGWVSVGMVLGRRLLTNFFNQSTPNAAASAVAGASLLTFVLVLSKLFVPLHGLFLLLLVPLAAGGVILTRFGMIPYASTGHPVAPRTPSSSVLPAPLPAPKPQTPVVDQDQTHFSGAQNVVDDDSVSEERKRRAQDELRL